MAEIPMRGRFSPLKLAGLLLLAVLAGVGIFFLRAAPSLNDPHVRASLHDFVASHGALGWFVLLAIQYTQIFIPLIPGGPIQILAGLLYGPVWGLILCLMGITCATSTIFLVVRKLGRNFDGISRRAETGKLARYKAYLCSPSCLERIIFITFLIPGAPKDSLTYLFALTPISMPRFLLLSLSARIPALFTSLLLGDSLADGDWHKAIACFLALTALSLGGLLIEKRLSRSGKGGVCRPDPSCKLGPPES